MRPRPISNGMSNVLPEDLQRTIIRSYLSRFLAAASIVTIVIAALFALALAPGYLALRIQEQARPGGADISKSASSEDRTALLHTQSQLTAVAPIFSASTTPATVIVAALALRPPGISIDRIAYIPGAPGKLVLSGSAVHRENLSAYREALAKSTYFTSASVPVSDLAGAARGQFSITLTGNF